MKEAKSEVKKEGSNTQWLPHSTANSESPSVISQLCEWISATTLENIPPSVIERAKHLILDGIACGLVGARVPWSKAAFDAISQFEVPGNHAIIGYKERFGPITAALLNGTFIQACELDDYHSIAPLHSLSVVLPALFAASTCPAPAATAPAPTTGATLLLAAIIGFEVGPRAGLALHGGEMLTKGWHSGPVFGAPAAAAATAKLCDLSAAQTEDAIGIACTQAGGLMAAQYEGSVKRMQHAFAARNGLLGALLARGKYGGIKKVFERPYGGFLAMFSLGSKHEPRYKVEEVVKGLGELWHTTELIRVKLHACVGGCHGLIEVLARMQEKEKGRLARENLGKVKEIRIGLSNPIFHHDGWAPEGRPLTTTGAQMNAAYIAATRLVDGEILLSQFANSMLDRDEVWELTHKASCYHAEECDKPNKGCGARVIITFEDDTVIEDVMDAPKGYDPPVSNEEIVDKYRRLTRNVISKERQEKIEKLVIGLDSLENVEDLLSLLNGDVANPLE